MNRSQRVIRALASGVGTTALNTLYTVVAVPLALRYLSLEEFGLWSLVAQVSTFLTVVDYALSGSMSRILIEEKDNEGSQIYADMLATVKVVTRIQGLIAIAFSVIMVLVAVPYFNVPPAYRGSLRILIFGHALIFGINLAVKWMDHLLAAHQRSDVLNHYQSILFAIALPIQWGCFALGFGLYSLLVASTIPAIISIFWRLYSVKALGLIPQNAAAGRFDRGIFKNVFAFGYQLVFQVLGWQLLANSQIIVITQLYGLGAAGIYGTCAKTFGVIQQLVFRVFDSSVAGLSELTTRGEHGRMKQRFLEITGLGGAAAVIGGVFMAACNAQFIAWWTKGRVVWDPINDWLLAGLLVAYSVNRIHGGLAWITKAVRDIRFVYPLEGITAITAGVVAAGTFGISGLIVVSIVCNFLFSGLLGARATFRSAGIPISEMLRAAWLWPAKTLLGFGVPAFLWWQYWQYLPVLSRVSVVLAGILPLGAFAFWRWGVPTSLRSELLARFKK